MAAPHWDTKTHPSPSATLPYLRRHSHRGRVCGHVLQGPQHPAPRRPDLVLLHGALAVPRGRHPGRRGRTRQAGQRLLRQGCSGAYHLSDWAQNLRHSHVKVTATTLHPSCGRNAALDAYECKQRVLRRQQHDELKIPLIECAHAGCKARQAQVMAVDAHRWGLTLWCNSSPRRHSTSFRTPPEDPWRSSNQAQRLCVQGRRPCLIAALIEPRAPPAGDQYIDLFGDHVIA